MIQKVRISFFNPVMGPLFTTVDPTQDGYRRTFPSMHSLINNHYETYHEDWGNPSSLVVENFLLHLEK